MVKGVFQVRSCGALIIMMLIALVVQAGAAELPVSWPDAIFAPATVRVVPPEQRPVAMPPSMQAFWMKNLPYKGKQTEVFAIYGMPPKASAQAKVPGIVLLHGGGGTAFYEWVKLWNARGYAAVAVDLCGNRPETVQRWYNFNVVAAPQGGPAGWDNAIACAAKTPVADQWLFHAVAAAVTADTFLRSRPEVVTDQIGVLGISWGGVTAILAAAVDHRFKYMVAIYGGGGLATESFWSEAWKSSPDFEKFVTLFDPGHYAAAVCCPALMVNSTNDKFFTFGPWNGTADLLAGATRRSLKIGMGHSYPPEGDPEEAVAFIAGICGRGDLLPTVGPTRILHGQATAEFTGKVVRAELCYTMDGGRWLPRQWARIPARIEGHSVVAVVPDRSRAVFLNVYDQDNRVVSSKYAEVK